MATAYTNFGGSGWRAGYFDISTTLTVNGSADIRLLVDGDKTSFSWSASTQAVAGKEILFKLYGSRRVIDAFKIYKAAGAQTAIFKFQGWDGSTWTDLTSFTWPSASGSTEFTFTNTTAYISYRFLGVSGNFTTNSHYEIEFSINSYSAYEAGNRKATITVSSSLTGGLATDIQELVGGDDTSWYPNSGQTVAGANIEFALAAAQTFCGIQLKSYYAPSLAPPSSEGFWKVQGSNDGSTWTDLTAPFEWVYGLGTYFSFDSQQGPLFNSPASYSYYQLLGVSGTTSNTPRLLEVEFDAGPTPDWFPTGYLNQIYSEIISDGAGSNLVVSQLKTNVLSQGPGSVATINQVHADVLISLRPAGELSGDTNAGIHHDITQWGGDDGPPDPAILSAAYVDEGTYTADINVNVGNPFKLKFTDDTIYRALMSRSLSARYVDDSTFKAEIGSLPPLPLQSFIVVTGR